MIWIPLTILILFYRSQWQIAVALLLFEVSPRVAPFDHEVLPRSQWIALFHRARERNFPLMIIFNTASLSSKMFDRDSFSERCALKGTWSTFERPTFWSNTCLILVCFGVLHQFPVCSLGLVSRSHYFIDQIPLLITSMTKSQKSSASKPSIRKPASNDMISDSEELWDSDVCFLHIQLIGTNVGLAQKHKTPSDVDFESSRSPASSESWNPVDHGEQCCQHDHIVGMHLCDECRKLIVPIVCRMPESILWQIVPVYCLTTECQVDQFVPRTSTL